MIRRLFLILTLIACAAAGARATDITVSQFTTTGVYQQADTVVQLRLYYSETFVDSLSNVIVGGPVAGANFYKSVSCTLNTSTKIVTCPSFTMPSTTDSSKTHVTVSGALFGGRTATALAQRTTPALFQNWKIPTSLGVTVTYAQLNTYNAARPLPSSPTYLNRDEVASLISSANMTPASRTISTTAPVRIDGGASADLSANRTLSVNTFTSSVAGTAPASGGGTTNFLRADGTWAAPSSGYLGSFTLGTLPASPAVGQFAYVTDSTRGYWVYTAGGWTPWEGRANVRAFGALGNNTADDGPAFALAISTTCALGGGDVFVPPGQYDISTSVASNLANCSLTISGVVGRSLIKPKTGTGVKAFVLSSAENVTLRDLIFATDNLAATTDALVTISFQSCLQATLQNVHFYALASIVAGGSIVEANLTPLTIRDSTFNGCSATSGLSTSVVTIYNWQGLLIENTNFWDYGNLAGATPALTGAASKTGVAGGSMAWIGINEPANSAAQTTWNARNSSAAIIRNSKFDEGAIQSIRAVGTVTKVINSLRVEHCQVNLSNIGGSSLIYANYVDNLLISDCMTGWVTAVQGHIVSSSDVKRLTIRNHNYSVANAGRILLNAAASYATMIYIEDSRYSDISAAAAVGHRVSVRDGALYRASYQLPAGITVPATIAPSQIFQMGSGRFDFESGTATAVGGAATLDMQSGTVTSEALTTAAGSSYTLTLTNFRIEATSKVIPTLDNGTNTQGQLTVGKVTPASGSVTIEVRNTHASQAFNGTIKIGYLVAP